MFHFFEGELIKKGESYIVVEAGKGIEIFYNWFQTGKVKLWLFPYFDENFHTIRYFAFDWLEQKKFFEILLKLPWIGPKTAFGIASLPEGAIEQALKADDVEFFKKLPWIWPKTAKRIIVDLKDNLPKFDESKVDEDLSKKIVNMLKWYGYMPAEIKKALQDVPMDLEPQNLKQIVQWLIKKL